MIKTNVSIRANDIGLIEFFYPKYTKTSEYSPFIETGVIFDGDSKYLPMFRDNNINYIYVKGTPEYDLTIPTNLLEFVFDKWDKKPPNKLLEYVSTLDFKYNSSEIYDICKQVWVTGKYTLVESTDKRINIFDSLAKKSQLDLIIDYIRLIDGVDSEKVFYSILHFLEKSTNPSSVKNPYMRRMIDSFVVARKSNVKNALLDYLYSPIDNNDLKVLKLLEGLTQYIK